MPLPAARFARTYLDANRQRGDIDLDPAEGGRWPYESVPSGKALVWRSPERRRWYGAAAASIARTDCA